MRAIFQRNPRVSLLFAGSIEHLMRDLFTPRQRAPSQFGSFHELRPIAPDDWAEGLRSRFELDDCEIDKLPLRRLVELGAGHPRATMLIAQKTHMTSVLLDTQEIDLATVEQGYRAALSGPAAELGPARAGRASRNRYWSQRGPGCVEDHRSPPCPVSCRTRPAALMPSASASMV
jgi:hypothetical protein